jgi:hypothetical protein
MHARICSLSRVMDRKGRLVVEGGAGLVFTENISKFLSWQSPEMDATLFLVDEGTACSSCCLQFAAGEDARVDHNSQLLYCNIFLLYICKYM